MARVVVTGAAGMLGTALIDWLADRHEVIATDLVVGLERDGVRWATLDLCQEGDLVDLLAEEEPDLVVHAAAVVDVDRCERDPAIAQQLHVHATDVMSRALADRGAWLIYISSDSVFDGSKEGPYDEADIARPGNVYARTKLEGEAACLRLDNGIVLRTNIFGWSRVERQSFAEWIVKGLVDGATLRMFADVWFTPIHVTHLAEVIEEAWQARLHGLFHAAGRTVLTKYDFAILLGQVFGLGTGAVEAASVDDAGLRATRPKNMSLSSARLSSALGRPLPQAKAGLQLMRRQYEDGWVSRVKRRQLASGYRFWEVG
jgi:dTDP-4-dehydrorhamnose reductase